VRLGIQRIALFEGLPQRGIAHDDGIHHAEFVEGKLILAQDADFLWPRDGAFGRLDLVRQNFHERGLARAIRPGNRVAAPGQKATRDVFKETPVGKAHGDVIDGNQRTIIIA
jgi:hypothetical protein